TEVGRASPRTVITLRKHRDFLGDTPAGCPGMQPQVGAAPPARAVAPSNTELTQSRGSYTCLQVRLLRPVLRRFQDCSLASDDRLTTGVQRVAAHCVARESCQR